VFTEQLPSNGHMRHNIFVIFIYNYFSNEKKDYGVVISVCPSVHVFRRNNFNNGFFTKYKYQVTEATTRLKFLMPYHKNVNMAAV
jgi:hypothetical protein